MPFGYFYFAPLYLARLSIDRCSCFALLDPFCSQICHQHLPTTCNRPIDPSFHFHGFRGLRSLNCKKETSKYQRLTKANASFIKKREFDKITITDRNCNSINTHLLPVTFQLMVASKIVSGTECMVLDSFARAYSRVPIKPAAALVPKSIG